MTDDVEAVATTEQHEWRQAPGGRSWDMCAKCGVIRSRRNNDKPCRGAVPVLPRASDPDVEAVARAICVAANEDPDVVYAINRGPTNRLSADVAIPNWMNYHAQARAAIAADPVRKELIEALEAAQGHLEEMRLDVKWHPIGHCPVLDKVRTALSRARGDKT